MLGLWLQNGLVLCRTGMSLVFSSLGDVLQEILCLYFSPRMKGGDKFCYTKIGTAEHPGSDKREDIKWSYLPEL